MKYEARAAIPLQMSVEIGLHDSNDRHRGLVARRLRILNHLAEHHCPLDVQHPVLCIVVAPPQTFEFFQLQPRERQHHERSLQRVMAYCVHDVADFFMRVSMCVFDSAPRLQFFLLQIAAGEFLQAFLILIGGSAIHPMSF